MSSMIQLPVNKRVPYRSVLNLSGFFSILRQLGVSKITDNRVHPGGRILRTEDLLFSLDTQVVKSF